jgi:hypothetical protein
MRQTLNLIILSCFLGALGGLGAFLARAVPRIVYKGEPQAGWLN